MPIAIMEENKVNKGELARLKELLVNFTAIQGRERNQGVQSIKTGSIVSEIED